MKVFLDACVLYPTVMRAVLENVAAAGLFQPVWSDRVLEEWARAAGRQGPEVERVARGEIATFRARWPDGGVAGADAAGLWLPDPDDVHVLAAAKAGGCDGILTLNTKDFPARVLAAEGLARLDPDGFLSRMLDEAPGAVAAAAESVRAEAARLSGEPWEIRTLMKKARLPRFGKALARQSTKSDRA